MEFRAVSSSGAKMVQSTPFASTPVRGRGALCTATPHTLGGARVLFLAEARGAKPKTTGNRPEHAQSSLTGYRFDLADKDRVQACPARKLLLRSPDQRTGRSDGPPMLLFSASGNWLPFEWRNGETGCR